LNSKSVIRYGWKAKTWALMLCQRNWEVSDWDLMRL
jgi:hypothetical protein